MAGSAGEGPGGEGDNSGPSGDGNGDSGVDTSKSKVPDTDSDNWGPPKKTKRRKKKKSANPKVNHASTSMRVTNPCQHIDAGNCAQGHSV